MIKANGTGGFTIGNVAGVDRIQNVSNEFAFLTDGNAYADIQASNVNLAGELNFTSNANKYIDIYTLANSNSLTIRHHNPSGNVFEDALKLTANAGAKLFYNNALKFETTNTGATLTGALTATSFVGDGSNLTGVSGAVSAVANGSNDRIATFSSSTALYGESALTFNGSTLAVTGALTATSTITTGYGVSFTNGNTNFLMYNNTNDNILYMRDLTNSAMIQTWGVNSVQIHKGLIINETGGNYDTRIEGDTDTDLLFVDASTDRVGISTNSPGNLFTVNSTTAYQASIQYDASTRLRISVESSGKARLYTDNNERVGIESGGFYVQPTNKIFLDGGLDTWLNEPTANTIGFGAGGAERMRMTTTTLDLGSGDFSIKKTGGNNTNNYPAVEVYSSGTGDTGAAIAIQQQTSEGDTIIFADFEPHVEWGISAENGDNRIDFTGGSSSPSLGTRTFKNNAGASRTAYRKMSVQLDDGNVSVAGTLTGTSVHVGATGERIHFNSDGTAQWGSAAAHGRLTWDTNQAIVTTVGSNDLNLTAAAGRSVIVNNYQSNIDFRVKGDNIDDQIFCDASSGRVGIGEDSLDANLHISGSPVVLKFDRVGVRALRMGVPDDSSDFVFADSDDLKSSQRMELTGGGDVHVVNNLGIGTAAPEDVLHVHGTSGNTQVRIKTTANANAQVRYQNDSQSWIVGINSNDQYAWYSSQLATNAAMIHVDGYFYSYKGIRLSTNNIPIQTRDAAGNLANLATHDASDILTIGDATHTEQIKIKTAHTGGNGAIHLTSSGNVIN